MQISCQVEYMIKIFRNLVVLLCFFISACGSGQFEANKQRRMQRAEYEAQQKALLLDAITWPTSSSSVGYEVNEISNLNSPLGDSLPGSEDKQVYDEVDTAKVDEGKSEKEGFYQNFLVPKWNKNLKTDVPATFNNISGGGTSLNDALEYSTEVLEAEAAIFEAVKERSIIETGLGLQTTGSFQAGSQSLRGNTNGLYTSVNSDKLLADGGLTNARLIVANNIIDVAYNQYLLAIDEVLLQAAQTYLDYERNKEIHEGILKNKEVAMPLLENLERLKLVGLIDGTKVLTAKQTFSKLDLAETEVLSRIAVVSDSLLDIFGTKAEKIDVKSADITNSIADNNILKESQSFEVEIAKLNLEVAIGQLKEHEKSKWGALSGRVVLDVPVSQDNAGADASVGLIFTKTFSDAGRHVQIKKKLEANINRKQNFLRTAEDAAKVQILSLLEQLNTLKKTQNLNETIKSNVQLKIVQLNKQLSIGSTEFGELLQSRVELFNLERDLINLETEISLTQLRFLRATGQLKAILKISPTLERENL